MFVKQSYAKFWGQIRCIMGDVQEANGFIFVQRTLSWFVSRYEVLLINGFHFWYLWKQTSSERWYQRTIYSCLWLLTKSFTIYFRDILSLFKSINWYFCFYKKAVVWLSFKRKSRLNLQTKRPIQKKATFFLLKRLRQIQGPRREWVREGF